MLRPSPSFGSAIALPVAAALTLLGCHRPVQPLDSPEAAWRPQQRVEDPSLESWLDDSGNRRARSLATEQPSLGPTIDAPTARRLVLERHPDIRAALAELERAQAHARAAGAWPNPELEGRVLFDEQRPGELEAGLAFTLPISGRLAAARRAAGLERDMARIALDAARHEALLELDRLLTELAHHRLEVALTHEIATGSQQLASLVQQRQAAALADPLDVTIVLAEAARDQGAHARAQARLLAVEARLQALLGLEPGQHHLAPPAIEAAQLGEGRSALLEAARQRASWRLAQLELERAEWAAREASRARIPEPSLGPAVAGEPDQLSLGLRLGLPIPILAPGGAAYRAAVAERDAAHQRLIAEGHETVREIDALLAEIEGLERALEAVQGASLGSARQAARLAEERYQAGQLDVLHLQSARRAWADIESETLDLLLELRHTQLELERAIGRPLALTPRATETP
jgi:cobalt-zinc-cadmium efflux system outer membrane protein